jgi:hypothetical protein
MGIRKRELYKFKMATSYTPVIIPKIMPGISERFLDRIAQRY